MSTPIHLLLELGLVLHEASLRHQLFVFLLLRHAVVLQNSLPLQTIVLLMPRQHPQIVLILLNLWELYVLAVLIELFGTL